MKIGFTDNLDVRHKQLEAHYGCDLAILATVEGGREEESEIHGRFAHLRFGRTEQFRPAPELMEFIGRPLLVGANPDAVEAMETATQNKPVRIDDESLRWARIAASYKGMTLAEYVSEALLLAAKADVERSHAAITASEATETPRRPKKGRGGPK